MTNISLTARQTFWKKNRGLLKTTISRFTQDDDRISSKRTWTPV